MYSSITPWSVLLGTVQICICKHGRACIAIPAENEKKQKKGGKEGYTCRPMFASMHCCHALNHHACSKIHIWSAPRSTIVVFTNACKIFCSQSHIYPSHGSHHKHLKPNKEARMATTEHQKRTHTPGTLQSVLSTSMRLLQIWQITSAVIET